MKKISYSIVALSVLLSGCVQNEAPKPKTVVKEIVKETKTVREKYYVQIDKQTKQAVSILIEKLDALVDENKKLQEQIKSQKQKIKELKQAKRQKLKKNIIENKTQKQKKTSIDNIDKNILGTYKVKTFAVNVRQYPTVKNSRILYCLYKNNIVDIIGQKNDWRKLKDGSWIWVKALKKIDKHPKK